jgi:hypothetical protein
LTVLAFTGLFDLVEARFYNPSITNSLTKKIEGDAESIGRFLSELQDRFSATLQEAPVKRSFLPNQSREDIFERSRIYGILMESLGGLQSVRFIDVGGIRLHYSTSAQDILRQDGLSIAYRNYTDDASRLPYEEITAEDREGGRLILDEGGERILFSLPFYDSFDVYRGTALFTLSVRTVAERLISEGRITVGEYISLLGNPQGILIGLPPSSAEALLPRIASVWEEGLLSLTSMDSVNSGALALISSKTGQNIFVGHLIHEAVFVFPQVMKIILLASIFLTLYLTIFLFFNLRQDSMTLVQNRLKRLQISLIEQYYERKGEMDWGRWRRELEQRRDEIRSELKQGIKAKPDKQGVNDIDVLIDKSWDELLTVIGGRRDNVTANIDEEKLQNILNRILAASGNQAPQVKAPAPQAPAAASRAEAEELETLEDVEPVDDVEALEEAESVDDVEALEEAEPVDDVEALEEAEPVDDVEALEEAEALEEVEPVEEALEEVTAGSGPVPAEKGQKQSDIKLVFEGNDSLPYIESANFGLVDTPVPAGEDDPEEMEELEPEDELLEAKPSGLLAKAQSIEPSPEAELETPEEAEELDELEELDEVEELGDVEGPSYGPPAPRSAEETAADLASRIEFTPLPEIDEGSPPLEMDLEIVSPFATVLSGFAGKEEEDLPPAPANSPEPQAALNTPENTPASGDEKKKRKGSKNQR